ncbi:MAG: YbjQ family protein [Phycisphaerae bacterium]
MDPMFIILLQFSVVLIPLALGFLVGTYTEQRHFASLARREADYQHVVVSNLRTVTNPQSVRQAELLMADAVMATDYFKGFVAGFRNLIGGRVRSYETLMERARREALLRLLEQARRLGYAELWNVRFESSNIMSGARRTPSVSVEIFAYATAVSRTSVSADSRT